WPPKPGPPLPRRDAIPKVSLRWEFRNSLYALGKRLGKSMLPQAQIVEALPTFRRAAGSQVFLICPRRLVEQSRLAREAAIDHVGVRCDNLKDKTLRKRISSQPQRESPSANTGWLDLEALAQVEVTSEDATHPIESALLTIGATGWRAENPGEQ